jgi:hypothetical protein
LFSPGLVFEVGSELWVLESRQPVVAVLDADASHVRKTLSWREVAPGPSGPHPSAPQPRVLCDGAGLWVQTHPYGGLARLTRSGVASVTWTDWLGLRACHGGVAWCTPAPPRQMLISGPGARPTLPALDDDTQMHGSRLLRVDSRGAPAVVRVHHPVRHVQADESGLLVQVDLETWQRRDLGGELDEAVYDTRWLHIPTGERPESVSLDSDGLPDSFVAPPDPFLTTFAHPGLSRTVPAALWSQTVTAAVDPRREAIAGVFDNQPLDITDLCWPLVAKPADADSYVAQMVQWHEGFDADYRDRVAGTTALDMDRVSVRASGDWPDTLWS